MGAYKLRYTGTRWRIVYGSYDGVEKFAVDELQRMVQRRVPYVVEAVPAASAPAHDGSHLILVGTASANAPIADLARSGAITLPSHAEGYSLKVFDSPSEKGARIAVIVGADARGVLYGVEDFNARVLATLGGDTAAGIRKALDTMPDMSASEFPRVPTRGIWSWGYVIYDYRRFLDHMARLRMNSITIWNDTPPVNCADVISYAHSRGLEVILAFQWGWGTALNLSKQEERQAVQDEVLAKYHRDYKRLGIDGLYFQTNTEHSDVMLKGRTTAAWACLLANDVSAKLLEDNPALRIYFGLHATSIGDKYGDLAPLDPRVTITWEDLGAIPYSYEPTAELKAEPGGQYKEVPHTPEETLAYSRRLAAARPGAFTLVPKGWTSLSWPEEFEHHETFILGERGRDFTKLRLALRQPRWDYINALWIRNYPLAARFYREMLQSTGGKVAAWGLIEDGLFEEAIQPSAAIFAETLWNPDRSDADILTSAMSPYYGIE